MTEQEFKNELERLKLKPLFIYNEDLDTTVYEFQQEHKKLSFFIKTEQIEYLKCWGPHIHYDMQEGSVNSKQQIQELIQWLKSI